MTHSRRVRTPGLLKRMTASGDQDAEHLTAMVIGARDLLVGTHGEQRGTTVLSRRGWGRRTRLAHARARG